MLRNHVTSNIGSVGFFVNSFVTIVALAMIGGAYFTAVAQIAA